MASARLVVIAHVCDSEGAMLWNGNSHDCFSYQEIGIWTMDSAVGVSKDIKEAEKVHHGMFPAC